MSHSKLGPHPARHTAASSADPALSHFESGTVEGVRAPDTGDDMRRKKRTIIQTEAEARAAGQAWPTPPPGTRKRFMSLDGLDPRNPDDPEFQERLEGFLRGLIEDDPKER